jgi:hypothetical protein
MQRAHLNCTIFRSFSPCTRWLVAERAAVWLRRRPWHTEWELAAELGGRAKMVASPWPFRRCQSS